MTQTNFIFQTITGPVLKVHEVKSATSVVLKVCSANPKGSTTSSHGVSGCISLMAKLHFFFKLLGYCYVKNNLRTSLIGAVFISYDR